MSMSARALPDSRQDTTKKPTGCVANLGSIPRLCLDRVPRHLLHRPCAGDGCYRSMYDRSGRRFRMPATTGEAPAAAAAGVVARPVAAGKREARAASTGHVSGLLLLGGGFSLGGFSLGDCSLGGSSLGPPGLRAPGRAVSRASP